MPTFYNRLQSNEKVGQAMSRETKRVFQGCGGLAKLLVLTLTLGCGRRDPASKFVPPPGDAQAVLIAALEDWKAGAPTGPVANSPRSAFIVDSARRDRPKLADYKILGETPGNAPRCYAVHLFWANPEREERTRFVIVGIDPLWIFRQEDFDLLMHWEHAMEKEKPKDVNPEAK